MSEKILRTENLGINFGGLKAVSGVNITIEKDQIYGLIGPNGAGKTTVFNLLTGVYKPTSGTFYLCGENLGGKKQIEICKKGIARTFQNIRLFNNMTVAKNVMVGLNNNYNCTLIESMFRLPRHYKAEKEMRNEARELLRVFNLDEDRNTIACNLPYGKQRRLEIARALATKPKLLLLDEPAAGMNPHETEELMEMIKFVRSHFNITILLIEHDMKLVGGICDKLTVLNFGEELISGETKEVLNDPKVVRAYLGDE